jgi:hypothetical protein
MTEAKARWAMARRVVLLAIVLLVVGVRPIQAQSTPLVNVQTAGIELCPQFICGKAIFVGVLFGRVGPNPFALGAFVVGVEHDDLPPPNQFALITGGAFEFKVGLRRLGGLVKCGTLYNTGQNTFEVRAILEIQNGGSGHLLYGGLLDHNVFPPTVIGPVVTYVDACLL